MTIRRPLLFALSVNFVTLLVVAVLYFIVIPVFFIGDIPFD
jgi:hypothetical protein